jgi:hypothetical protein
LYLSCGHRTIKWQCWKIIIPNQEIDVH